MMPRMATPHPDLQHRLLLYAAALVTVVVYWSGLQGPFLLDDLANIAPLQQWRDGQASAAELILGNRSGMLGRSLSMATLWLSAATGGLHPFPFKLGNLLVHLLCGLAGWKLLSHLLAADPRFAARARLVAAVLAALWLLHPIHVSTVLYAVQRMAQLGALFALLSLWTYVSARRQLAVGDVRPAAIKLFLLFPLLLVAGLLSKENAVVIPALCLVVELAYFMRQPRSGWPLPTFHALFVLVPAVLAAIVLITEPGKYLGYGNRDFTLLERLLSQPRALMEYIGLMAWPRGGMMGVFVDDFAPSRGLLSPPSTLFALLGLLGASGFAIALRKRAPSIFAGWFFFLVAHGLESTILPLDLYFEHRNYLPAFGLLLAFAGLVQLAASRFGGTWHARAGWALTAIAALAFALVTWQQARVWRSEEAIARQALEHRPGSLRATLALVTVAVRDGRMDEASALADRLAQSPDPRHRLLGHVHGTSIDCLRGAEAGMARLQQAERTGVAFITLADAQAYTLLTRVIDAGYCGAEVNPSSVADSISRLLDATPEQGDGARPKLLLRATAANLYSHAGSLEDARDHARIAWGQGRADTAIGGLLVELHMQLGDKAAAQATLDQVRGRVSARQRGALDAIGAVQARIDAMPE